MVFSQKKSRKMVFSRVFKRRNIFYNHFYSWLIGVSFNPFMTACLRRKLKTVIYFVAQHAPRFQSRLFGGLNGFLSSIEIDLALPLNCQHVYDLRVQNRPAEMRGGKGHRRRKGENFLARHSVDGPGEVGGRKGGIIEYNLIEPRVSTPLNRA